MIGKAYVSLNNKDVAMTLTLDGSTYSITKDDTSKSASNVYSYSRSDENWVLTIYVSGTINFSKLGTPVDICVVGGGGGGGGGYAYYSGGYQAKTGGAGGGGTYNEANNQKLSKNTSYSVTIGSGGSAGIGSDSATSYNGGVGGTTSVGSIVSASGGGGGGKGAWGSNGSVGNPNGSSQYVFGDSSYLSVSGSNRASYRGGGGAGGNAGYRYGGNGGAGAAGVIVIRNAR